MLDWINHLSVFLMGAASFSLIGGIVWVDSSDTQGFVALQTEAFIIWTYIFLICEIFAFSGWYLL